MIVAERKIIQVEEKVPFKLLLPLSLQHMFAMFGASVLVPFIFGINPAIVLFMNGLGTLLFIFITKGKAPAYLGSSFAFFSVYLQKIQVYPLPFLFFERCCLDDCYQEFLDQYQKIEL